ncbi:MULTISPECIES: hypothetical protein [unclassified Variovorax]|uniref:hypothetical protein n=1 Tax=unclassified Variovorax TaxID=663243 RepID=UPI002578BC5E|nr:MULTISPECIES: hypothetical protein [unclassified Variovorax]MDM0090282.1 hypothetical protein [Variovorax sp. J22G40]MDM0148052.1 hypothetical protein [Variovorax sp. J2P1-31]
MPFDIVSIDAVKRAAHAAAERGASLNDACPWPFDSEAGRQFKQLFILHKAALQALATESLS